MKALWELISVMSSMKEEDHGSVGVAYGTVMKSGSGGQEKCSREEEIVKFRIIG